MNDQIMGGAFTIARRIFTSEIWRKDPMYLKIWLWIIGRANHSDAVKDGFKYVRGELVTTYGEIQNAGVFIRNRKRSCPSIKTIRIILEWLKNEGMINVEPLKMEPCRTGADTTALTGAYIGIKIIVINYDTYQDLESYKGRHKGRHLFLQGHNNNNDYNKNDKETPEISKKISLLKVRYPDQGIIGQALQAIASTRKSNRIADTVTLSILQEWERYPVESVLSGVRTYLEKGYADQGKREKYLLGIIRGYSRKPEAIPQLSQRKSPQATMEEIFSN